MSNNQHIKQLLHKFILNECNAEEIHNVVEYYRQNQLTEEFPSVEDIKQLLGTLPQMDYATADKLFINILSNAKETPVIRLANRKKSYKKYITVAASLALLLTIGLTYQFGFKTVNKNQPVLTGNEITLQLENGDIQVISENGQTLVTDANGKVVGNQKGSTIIYDAETGLEKLVYNTLKIPYGKRFQLQLSDGTLVHLNAGTSLKYPVKFIAGQSRKVFLDGEAFFDVAKDKKHPFVVNADNLNIRVLGTHFNVSNYPEDDLTDVVLVEGSVGMYNATEEFDATKSTILKPGFKGSFLKKDNSIATRQVTTDVYTAWIHGGLYFRNMSFKNIAKKLERHYNITIANTNGALAHEKFNASFKDEPIEKVLSYFNDVYGIKYTITNNLVQIK